MPASKPPRPEVIRDHIHRLAADTANIAWSTHALQRMTQRDIVDRVAIEVLRKGSVQGSIEAGANRGEWKVKMVREVRGRREVGVVVTNIRNKRLLVITVEWEDLK